MRRTLVEALSEMSVSLIRDPNEKHANSPSNFDITIIFSMTIESFKFVLCLTDVYVCVEFKKRYCMVCYSGFNFSRIVSILTNSNNLLMTTENQLLMDIIIMKLS